MRFDVCKLVFIFLFATISRAGLLPPHRNRIKQVTPKSPPQQCTFNTVKYNISQTWYPFMLPNGYFSCIKCVCELFKGSARLVCKRKKCKKTKCSKARIVAGDCCKKCPVTSVGQPPQHSASCTYLGKKYTHGTVWKIPDLTSANLCTECSCSDGFVSCAIRTCPKPTCSNPIKIPGSCCEQCPGKTNKQTTPSNQAGCNSLGRHYQEGEQWHPRLPLYRHKCIVCKCKNLTTRCSRVSCDGLNCSKRCCKQCKVPTTLAPSTTNPTIYIKNQDCYNPSHHKHNTSWKPIIAGRSLPCVVCTCLYSRVQCARIICPKSYPCFKPVQKNSRCCKHCPGQLINVTISTINKTNPCRHGNTWRVYEYFPGSQSKIRSNNARNDHFILESTLKDKVEVHILRANKTHKDIRIKEMYKADFLILKSLPSPTMKLREIGVIKDARKRKIEIKSKKKCTNNCTHDIDRLIKMLRLRSRWCRSPPPIFEHFELHNGP